MNIKMLRLDLIQIGQQQNIFIHFILSTMRTQAESINSDLQRGLDRCLRHTHTTLDTERNQLAIKVSADN